ncbi:MAG: zinc-binding dehydrogenase [Thermoplasmata archaeon]|nr:zinc-binding dehydrogenase [Thermoplasmata archaeon]
MNGFGFSRHGGASELGFFEVPEPEPGPGEVRIAIRAASFNRLDRFVLQGIPGVPVGLPHVLGSDGAGVVDRLGSGVEGLSLGDSVLFNPGLWDASCEACRAGQEALCRSFRIVGEHTQGSAAPFVTVPSRNVHAMPSGWSYGEAASVPLVFQTAWRALRTVGALQAGESVAIVGSGGAVNPAAIQVAKASGARVVVVARNLDKAERCRAMGADDVLAFDDGRPLDRVLWEWSGKRGVDVIFDSVGAPTVGRSVRALARGGRVVVIGATQGPEVTIDLRTLFWRQASVRGSTMANRSEFDAVLAELSAGRLKPVVDSTYPFAKGVDAFARAGSPAVFGKVVLSVPG